MKYKYILNTILSVTAAVAIVGCSTGTSNKRSTGQYIDDKGTAQRVRHNLSKDSLVKATKVHVESFRGNVHLTGFVDYPAQKQHAEEIARNTEGVEWVKDDIIVKTELPAAQVGGRTQISEPAGARRGSASYQSSGAAPSAQFQAGAAAGGASAGAASSAGWVRGNRGMNAELYPGEFKGEPAGAQRPSSQAGAQSSQSGYQASQTASQGDLAQRVKSELQSDNTLQGQNIMVEQDGDKIILRGTVASKEQKQALEAKAKAIPGVKSVSNKIDVQ